MDALAAALLALGFWALFVVTSCAVFAMGSYLADRKAARAGDFLLEARK